MSDAYLGEIRILPYTFAPEGWAACDGKLLDISQYSALFAILGTIYGGDGRINFALPNLRARMPLGAGQAPGHHPYNPGWMGGSTTTTLVSDQLPNHTHEVIGVKGRDGETNDPANAYPGGDKLSKIYMQNPSNKVNMATEQLTSAGGGQAHPNIQPFITVNYCICIDGLFPPRN